MPMVVITMLIVMVAIAGGTSASRCDLLFRIWRRRPLPQGSYRIGGIAEYRRWFDGAEVAGSPLPDGCRTSAASAVSPALGRRLFPRQPCLQAGMS